MPFHPLGTFRHPGRRWADDPSRGAAMTDGFEAMVAEGEAVPVEGWDFTWFDGRATEERPPWGYARMMGERMGSVACALDIETGGGEVLATVPRPPKLLVATESWPPNVAVARQNLLPLGAHVVAVADAPTLPFVGGAFDLVVSRHPVVTLWDEIARVLRPGGTYLSQQIGAGTNRELTEFMMGPQRVSRRRGVESLRAEAEDAHLEVIGLQSCASRRGVLRRRRGRLLPQEGPLDRARLRGPEIRPAASCNARAHRTPGGFCLHRPTGTARSA